MRRPSGPRLPGRPPETGLRYCMNGTALKFEPKSRPPSTARDVGPPEIYRELTLMAQGLFHGERDAVANAANPSALLWMGLADLTAGFYFKKGPGWCLALPGAPGLRADREARACAARRGDARDPGRRRACLPGPSPAMRPAIEIVVPLARRPGDRCSTRQPRRRAGSTTRIGRMVALAALWLAASDPL